MAEYVGFDVPKEETAFCIQDRDGRVLARGKAATGPAALFEVVKEHCLCPERIVMETGPLCRWLVRELRSRGLCVELTDARAAHAVMKLQHNKTDANDAGLLARIARTGFFRPVAVKSAAAQGDRLALEARQHLVRQRRDTENAMRGLPASPGRRFPKGTVKFTAHVRAILDEHPGPGMVTAPLPGARAAVPSCLEELDKEVVTRANTKER